MKLTKFFMLILAVLPAFCGCICHSEDAGFVELQLQMPDTLTDKQTKTMAAEEIYSAAYLLDFAVVIDAADMDAPVVEEYNLDKGMSVPVSITMEFELAAGLSRAFDGFLILPEASTVNCYANAASVLADLPEGEVVPVSITLQKIETAALEIILTGSSEDLNLAFKDSQSGLLLPEVECVQEDDDLLCVYPHVPSGRELIPVLIYADGSKDILDAEAFSAETSSEPVTIEISL